MSELLGLMSNTLSRQSRRTTQSRKKKRGIQFRQNATSNRPIIPSSSLRAPGIPPLVPRRFFPRSRSQRPAFSLEVRILRRPSVPYLPIFPLLSIRESCHLGRFEEAQESHQLWNEETGRNEIVVGNRASSNVFAEGVSSKI